MGRVLKILGRNLLISVCVTSGLIVFALIAGLIINALGPIGVPVVAALLFAIVATIIDLQFG